MSEPDDSGINRRRYPRGAFTRQIGVLAKGKFYICKAVETGEGGIAFENPIELILGQKIVISMQIPLGDFLCITATVKRPGTVVGVGFDDISFTHRRQLRSFVSKSAKEIRTSDSFD